MFFLEGRGEGAKNDVIKLTANATTILYWHSDQTTPSFQHTIYVDVYYIIAMNNNLQSPHIYKSSESVTADMSDFVGI